MAGQVAIVTRWAQRAPVAGAERLFVPALHRFPPPLRETLALLPVADINAALLAALAEAETPRGPEKRIAGLCAVDPFLDRMSLGQALRRTGMRRVANYPTVQLFEGATGAGLAAVGYGAQGEFETLRIMAAEGFDVLHYVASVAAAELALRMGAACLVVHPGLERGGDRPFAGRIAKLADAAGVPLLRHVLAGRPRDRRAG